MIKNCIQLVNAGFASAINFVYSADRLADCYIAVVLYLCLRTCGGVGLLQAGSQATTKTSRRNQTTTCARDRPGSGCGRGLSSYTHALLVPFSSTCLALMACTLKNAGLPNATVVLPATAIVAWTCLCRSYHVISCIMAASSGVWGRYIVWRAGNRGATVTSAAEGRGADDCNNAKVPAPRELLRRPSAPNTDAVLHGSCMALAVLLCLWYWSNHHFLPLHALYLILATTAIQSLRVNRFGVSCCLLAALLVQDVVCVFYSRLFEQVRNMLLLPIPTQTALPFSSSASQPPLAISQVILPGIMLAFLRRIDDSRRAHHQQQQQPVPSVTTPAQRRSSLLLGAWVPRCGYFTVTYASYVLVLSLVRHLHAQYTWYAKYTLLHNILYQRGGLYQILHDVPVTVFLVVTVIATPLIVSVLRGELKTLLCVSLDDDCEDGDDVGVAEAAAAGAVPHRKLLTLLSGTTCYVCHKALYDERCKHAAAPCGHIFHEPCIQMHQFESQLCPVCGKQLTAQSIIYGIQLWTETEMTQAADDDDDRFHDDKEKLMTQRSSSSNSCESIGSTCTLSSRSSTDLARNNLLKASFQSNHHYMLTAGRKL